MIHCTIIGMIPSHQAGFIYLSWVLLRKRPFRVSVQTPWSSSAGLVYRSGAPNLKHLTTEREPSAFPKNFQPSPESPVLPLGYCSPWRRWDGQGPAPPPKSLEPERRGPRSRRIYPGVCEGSAEPKKAVATSAAKALPRSSTLSGLPV